MAKSATQKTYDLMVTAKIEFNMTVAATSLEDAVAKAKELKIGDVLDAIPPPGECNDHNFEVTGVFRNSE